MSFDPAKDIAHDVGEEAEKVISGAAAALVTALGADEVVITIPEIVIKISFGKKA